MEQNVPSDFPAPPVAAWPDGSLQSGEAGPRPAPRPRGFAGLAWFFIALACATAVLLNALEVKKTPGKPGQGDRVNLMLTEVQAKYMVGAAASTPGETALIYAAAEPAMNQGGIGQRQRFIVFAAELMGGQEAKNKLAKLDELIAREQQSRGDESILTEDERTVQEALHLLYDGDAKASDLPPGARDALRKQLGWFGDLALAPRDGADATARQRVLRPARTIFYGLFGGAMAGVAAGVLGFIGLVVLGILALVGKVRSNMPPSPAHHGIYAETFALWMFLLLGLQIGAGIIGFFVPGLALVILLIAFFSSLLALTWPVLRGVPWRQVRFDIGWHGGGAPILEPIAGVAGYVMTLPVLGIGVAMTYVLMRLQQSMTPPGPIFDPPGGPSHPIIEQLGGPDWFPKIMVLALGAIAAPIVEETMFRGVLYRHLRDGMRNLGTAAGLIIGGGINSFVFAIIHPQGWVAVPALMSLAFMFTVMREWRGSIIPPMVMHGISNFIVLSLLIAALSM